jgi:hypothetical protein
MPEAIPQIQAGLAARLGCPVTVEDALVCWECFSGALYGGRWVVVDEGFLNLCASLLQAAARGEEPWGRKQGPQTPRADAVAWEDQRHAGG